MSVFPCSHPPLLTPMPAAPRGRFDDEGHQMRTFTETHFRRTKCKDCGSDSGRHRWYEKEIDGPHHKFFETEETVDKTTCPECTRVHAIEKHNAEIARRVHEMLEKEKARLLALAEDEKTKIEEIEDDDCMETTQTMPELQREEGRAVNPGPLKKQRLVDNSYGELPPILVDCDEADRMGFPELPPLPADTDDDMEVKVVTREIRAPRELKPLKNVKPANVQYMEVVDLFWDSERQCLVKPSSPGDTKLPVPYEIIPVSNVDPRKLKLNFTPPKPS